MGSGTGARPHLAILDAGPVGLDAALATAAPMKLSAALLGAGGGGDCLAQTGFGPETLTNPEPRFFILGAKSYGRNSAFLMRTGWEQVDDVFGLLESG